MGRWERPERIDCLKFLNHIPSTSEVFLTFDDGPNSSYTAQLLDLLDQHNAKASFFMLALKAKECKGLVQDVAKRGHVIGLHAIVHQNFCRQAPDEAIQNLLNGKKMIEEVSGKQVNLFRPPYGETPEFIFDTLDEQGIVSVGWSSVTQDWTNGGLERKCKEAIVEIKPGNIHLLHDGWRDRHSERHLTHAVVGTILSKTERFVFSNIQYDIALKNSVEVSKNDCVNGIFCMSDHKDAKRWADDEG